MELERQCSFDNILLNMLDIYMLEIEMHVSCILFSREIHLHKNELETFQLVQVINSWVCVWAAQDVRLCKAVDGGED